MNPFCLCFALICLMTSMVAGFCPGIAPHSIAARSRSLFNSHSFLSMVGGESSMVNEFGDLDQMESIVQLASQPIPERPDGIVVIVRYSSAQLEECKATEDEFERVARANPASLFLRNIKEYENADLLQSQVNVQTLPTHDLYYKGDRVRRIEGSNMAELEVALSQFQLENSVLDLFSEDAKKRDSAGSANATPRTTNRFVPGYDWNKKESAFDEAGGKAQQSFEDAFGGWLPNVDDDE